MDTWLNQEALNKALNIYRAALRPFIISCLRQIRGTDVESAVTDSLGYRRADEIERLLIQTDRSIESVIDINDFPYIVNKNWDSAFGPHLNDDKIFRNQLWLIVECRNAEWAHPPEGDAEFESTRAYLFLIADVLGKINKPDAKDRVESIRDGLLSDDTIEHLEKAEEAKVEYKRSLAEAEQRLAAAKSEKNEYAEKNAALSKQVDEKENQRKKLDRQLKRAKTQNEKYKKDIAGTKQRLEEFKAAQADYKNRLETTSKDLEDAKKEWQACEDSLRSTSERLEEAVEEWGTCVERLSAMRRLFTVATIGNQIVQAVYPPIETDSTVRILDRRGVDKKNYLLELLKQEQPTVIYVQSEEMADLLLERVVSEKSDAIEKHSEHTSEAEEMEILKRLENGELIAVVSDTTFSTLTSAHCVEHFVFCHLVPGLDEFFNQCEPAFASEKNAYLHFIYNSEQDIEGLAQRYPDREVLVEMYRELKKLAEANDDFIKTGNVYSELDIGKPSIETGLAVFEELQLLKQNGESIKLLPDVRTNLDQSEIYRRGEKLKKETADFQVFQFEQSIEQIWETLLKALNVDNEHILEASNVYAGRVCQDAIDDSRAQSEPSTDVVENDSKSDAEVSEVQSEPSTDAVENDSTVDSEDVEAKQPPKSTRKSSEPKKSAADKFREATSLDERKEIGRQVAEFRINASGSKPSWRSIRTKLGLKNDEFHKVIRDEDHYKESCVARIESFADGWEYNGKIEVLLGFEPVGELLERIEACKPTPKVETKKEAKPQVEESKDKETEVTPEPQDDEPQV